MKEDILIVSGLKKTFKLSNKQRKINRTADKVKVAVDDLSFAAGRGEIYGLLGPNGAGKTTTLRIISTLIKADAGDVVVCGCSVTKNPEKVREKIGFLTSELKLEDFFTPNYLFDYFSELHGVSEADRNMRKKELFSRFGIDEFREVKVGDLSTGMKQKISIAVSLVHDPEVIVFDEPTNGLDVITAKTVTDYLKELRDKGKTIIVSTHIFSLVEKICDRLAIIIDGKVALEGTLSEITANKPLEEVFFDVYVEKKGNEK